MLKKLLFSFLQWLAQLLAWSFNLLICLSDSRASAQHLEFTYLQNHSKVSERRSMLIVTAVTVITFRTIFFFLIISVGSICPGSSVLAHVMLISIHIL